MSDDKEFGLIERFFIDDGELEGLTPQECFVLGYEMAEVSALADKDEGFQKMVHAQNNQRLKAALAKRGREFSFVWMEGDRSESWQTLTVPPKRD